MSEAFTTKVAIIRRFKCMAAHMNVERIRPSKFSPTYGAFVFQNITVNDCMVLQLLLGFEAISF